MNNPFDEMRRSIAEAETTLRVADAAAKNMAQIIKGRLRHANSWDLKVLKRELRDFNIKTGKWKERS